MVLSRHFCTAQVVHECAAWAAWLVRAIGAVRHSPEGDPVPVPLAEVSAMAPAPGPRNFTAVACWPTLGKRPIPAERRRRARRS
jgi:hypothetical protein